MEALAVAPEHPGVVYAGSFFNGVYETSNRGWSWKPMNSGLAGTTTTVEALSVDPTDPHTVYLGLEGCCDAPGGMFKTTDSGRNWTLSDSGLPQPFPSVFAIAIDPSNTSIVYAGVEDGSYGPLSGVYVSTDGGANWVDSSLGFPTSSIVASIALDPSDPSTIYASACATAGGVYKSTDAGATWKPTGALLGCIGSLVIDPSDPSTVYASAGTVGVYKSTDGGGSWAELNTGFPPNTVVNAVVLDPAHPATLYAGTGKGVWKTVDAGGVWREFDSHLTIKAVQCLAIAGSTLYAGTHNGGVFDIETG
jgi:photosystem II stability/assembly factor-like uncharacterized protein